MRDRLIELITEYHEKWKQGNENWKNGLADHLIANGFILPPCKVGDAFYDLDYDGYIDECKVSALTQKADKSWKIRLTSGRYRSVFEITVDGIGKTVFLTKEEAEKCLKEKENE